MNKKLCLCCGKEIKQGLWHDKCIMDFFGSKELPEINLSNQDLKKIAIEQINEEKSIAGAQKKLSLHLELGGKKRPRMTIIGYPSGYIIKPQSSTYKRLPEFEHTAMLLASSCGLNVVKHGLIYINCNELAYITKRIDRERNEKIHMEDFCQASGNMTLNKYRSSYEECARLIEKHCKNPIYDKIRLFECLYFCFVIGNSDMHLKNFSFIMDENGGLSLSPFYDMVPTKIILPHDKEELGMLFNEKRHNLRKNDFDEFAHKIGISDVIKSKIMKSIDGNAEKMFQIIDESMLDQNSKIMWKSLIKSNIKRIAIDTKREY